ncbi:hypothetical protein AK88_05000 [Plasmodium fragile]|uniref:RAVE complex protein Rav1 C-terminal domain-containing protein n=1 Tax=Plasmodium fragile TaxID=5857 RepID=A0A0D9QED9_PLAFR|nr:uncharacterized protein AK88_05000 [Plasmodium fragile]KJP85373.1 hypothetical protein AK88_05000 [Plasmodium fragile]
MDTPVKDAKDGGSREPCYDQYNNEILLHLEKEPNLNNRMHMLKRVRGKPWKDERTYSPYDTFPYGGIFYHDLIVKDVIKYCFKRGGDYLDVQPMAQSLDPPTTRALPGYVYLGAGILKERQRKKHGERNRMVFIFCLNEALLRGGSHVHPSRRHSQAEGVSDVAAKGGTLRSKSSRSKRQKKDNLLRDLDDILNGTRSHQNPFIKTKTSLLWEDVHNMEGGMCTDVNRDKKNFTFESFYCESTFTGSLRGSKMFAGGANGRSDHSTNDGTEDGTEDGTDEGTNGGTNDDTEDSRSDNRSDRGSFRTDGDSCPSWDHSPEEYSPGYWGNSTDESPSEHDTEESSSESSDHGGHSQHDRHTYLQRRRNVYSDPNGVFILNVLHHQCEVYSVKWKEKQNDPFCVITSICFDGYMYIWREHTNSQNKITFVSVCRIYVPSFEQMIGSVKWCWVDKDTSSENFCRFWGNNRKANIARNEYLIVYGSRNEWSPGGGVRRRGTPRGCDERERTISSVFSIYAIFNIYSHDAHVKNILSYENIPINLNYEYVLQAKIKYGSLNTSLISIYTDDTFLPENEYHMKFGQWKIKKICPLSDSLLLDKSNPHRGVAREFNGWDHAEVTECSLSSSGSGSTTDHNEEGGSDYGDCDEDYYHGGDPGARHNGGTTVWRHPRRKDNMKKKDFLLFRKLFSTVSNLMPPFALTISTYNGDLYKIMIKPSDIWIKKKKSVSVRYMLHYKVCEPSSKWEKKKKKLSSKGKHDEPILQEDCAIHFNVNHNAVLVQNKRNGKIYLYNFDMGVRSRSSLCDGFPIQAKGSYVWASPAQWHGTGCPSSRCSYPQETPTTATRQNKDGQYSFERHPNDDEMAPLDGATCHSATNSSVKKLPNGEKPLEASPSGFCNVEDVAVEETQSKHKTCRSSDPHDDSWVQPAEAKKRRGAFTPLCCLNSMYIDRYYMLKHKGSDTLRRKAHFIYSYSYQMCRMYEQVKKNPHVCISTSEFLEKKNTIPLTYKSAVMDSFDSFFVLMCVDKNREFIFALKSDTQDVVHNSKMLCIFDEGFPLTGLQGNSSPHPNEPNNNVYLNKAQEDIYKAEGVSCVMTGYEISDFHLHTKNGQNYLFLIIKYSYINSEKRTKHAHLVTLSTIHIQKESSIYINLELNQMFTFFHSMGEKFLFSYIHVSYQGKFIVATNHTLRGGKNNSVQLEERSPYTVNPQNVHSVHKGNCTLVEGQLRGSEQDGAFYHPEEDLLAVRKGLLQVRSSSGVEKPYVLVLDDEDPHKQEGQNEDKSLHSNEMVVNLYLLCTEQGSIAHPVQIRNVPDLVDIVVHGSYVVLLTKTKLQVVNLKTVCNDLIRMEENNMEDIPLSMEKTNILNFVSIPLPKMFENKKTKICMTCSGEKNTYFIVASFLVNLKQLKQRGQHQREKKICNGKANDERFAHKKYYVSVVLFCEASNDNEWKVLNYETNPFFLSKQVFLFENNLFLLSGEQKRRGFVWDPSQKKFLNEGFIRSGLWGRKGKNMRVITQTRCPRGQKLYRRKINLYNELKKCQKRGEGYMEGEKAEAEALPCKKKHHVFYHPLGLLQYIKMGLFSHVYMALKLLLSLLLNRFYNSVEKINVRNNISWEGCSRKKHCALHILLENTNMKKSVQENFGDICTVQKSNFLFNLNFLTTEMCKFQQSAQGRVNDDVCAGGDADGKEQGEEKSLLQGKNDNADVGGHKDKSMYLFEVESVSLDDFNLNSDEEESASSKKGSEEEEKAPTPSRHSDQRSSSDQSGGRDSTDQSECSEDERERMQRNFKYDLKNARVTNYQLTAEEVKILQILLLHVNVPHLRAFDQLLLFCVLNAFCVNLGAPPADDSNSESGGSMRSMRSSGGDGFDSSHPSEDSAAEEGAHTSKKCTRCHCENFGLHLQKELIKTENMYLYDHVHGSGDQGGQPNGSNMTQVILFFYRLYINCCLFLNINLEIHHQYAYLLYFVHEKVAEDLSNYLENLLTHYNHSFRLPISSSDLSSVDLFDMSGAVSARRGSHVEPVSLPYHHQDGRMSSHGRLVRWTRKENAPPQPELNNVLIEKMNNFKMIEEGVHKFCFFFSFRSMKLFYALHDRDNLFYLHEVLTNRTIKKMNSLNVEDKEKQNEVNECLDFLALLYLAKNEKQKLMMLYKIKKQQKIFEFLSNDFSKERWSNALMNNAYKLVQINRYYLAIAFFILRGDIKDVIDVAYQYLEDPQLSVFLIRLVYASYVEKGQGLGGRNNFLVCAPCAPLGESSSVLQDSSMSAVQGSGYLPSSEVGDMGNMSEVGEEPSKEVLDGEVMAGEGKEIEEESLHYLKEPRDFLQQYLSYIFAKKLKSDRHEDVHRRYHLQDRNYYRDVMKNILLGNYAEVHSKCKESNRYAFLLLVLKNVIVGRIRRQEKRQGGGAALGVAALYGAGQDTRGQGVSGHGVHGQYEKEYEDGDEQRECTFRMSKIECYFSSLHFCSQHMSNLSFILLFIFFHVTDKDQELMLLHDRLKFFLCVSSEAYLETFLSANKFLFEIIFASSCENKGGPRVASGDREDRDNSIDFTHSFKLFAQLVHLLFECISRGGASEDPGAYADTDGLTRGRTHDGTRGYIQCEANCNTHGNTHGDPHCGAVEPAPGLRRLLNKLRDIRTKDSCARKRNLSLFLTTLLQKINSMHGGKSTQLLFNTTSVNHYMRYEVSKNEMRDSSCPSAIPNLYVSLNKYNTLLTHLFFHFFTLHIVEEAQSENVIRFVLNYIVPILFIYVNDVVRVLFSFVKNSKCESSSSLHDPVSSLRELLASLHAPYLQIVILRVGLRNCFSREGNEEAHVSTHLKNNLKKNVKPHSNHLCEPSTEEGGRVTRQEACNKQEKIHNIYIKVDPKFFSYHMHLLDLFLCYLTVLVICFLMLDTHYGFFHNGDVCINKQNTQGNERRTHQSRTHKGRHLKKLFLVLRLLLKKIKKLNWAIENVYKGNSTISTADLLIKFVKCAYLRGKKGKLSPWLHMISGDNSLHGRMKKRKRTTSNSKQNARMLSSEGIDVNVTPLEITSPPSKSNLQNDKDIEPQMSIRSCEYVHKGRLSQTSFSFSPPEQEETENLLFEKYCIVSIFLSTFELLIGNFHIFAYKANVFTPQLHMRGKGSYSVKGSDPHGALHITYSKYSQANTKSHINPFYYNTCILLHFVDNLCHLVNKFLLCRMKDLLYNSAYNIKNTLLTFLSFPFFFNKIKTKKQNHVLCEHFIDSHISLFYNKPLYAIWKMNNCTYRSFLLFFNKSFYDYNDSVNDLVSTHRGGQQVEPVKQSEAYPPHMNATYNHAHLNEYMKFHQLYKQGCRISEQYHLVIPASNVEKGNMICNQSNFLFKRPRSYDRFFSFTSRMSFFKNLKLGASGSGSSGGDAKRIDTDGKRTNLVVKKTNRKSTLEEEEDKEKEKEKEKEKGRGEYRHVNYDNIFKIKKNLLKYGTVETEGSSSQDGENGSEVDEGEEEDEDEEGWNHVVSATRDRKGRPMEQDLVGATPRSMRNGSSHSAVNGGAYRDDQVGGGDGERRSDPRTAHSRETTTNANKEHQRGSNPRSNHPRKTSHKGRSKKEHNKLPHVIPLSYLFNNMSDRHVIEQGKMDSHNSTILYIHKKNKIKKISILDHLKKLNKKCRFINYISHYDLKDKGRRTSRGRSGIGKNKMRKRSVSLRGEKTLAQIVPSAAKKKKHKGESTDGAKGDRANRSVEVDILPTPNGEQRPWHSYSLHGKAGAPLEQEVNAPTDQMCKEVNQARNAHAGRGRIGRDRTPSGSSKGSSRGSAGDGQRNGNKRRGDKRSGNRRNEKIFLDINMNKLLYIYKCMHIQCMHNLTPLCTYMSNFVPNDCSVTSLFTNSYNNHFVNNLFFHNMFYVYDNTMTLLLNSNNVGSIFYGGGDQSRTQTEMSRKGALKEGHASRIPSSQDVDASARGDSSSPGWQEWKGTQKALLRATHDSTNVAVVTPTRGKHEREKQLDTNITISKTAQKYIETVMLLLYNNVTLNESDKIITAKKGKEKKKKKNEKNEFQHLLEYLERNANTCIRKKYNFINQLSNKKDSCFLLKTGAIISHPFLPVYALININHEKITTSEQQPFDKNRFQIRLCSFSLNYEHICYRYGIISSVCWSSNGNLLMISDECGHLYIYNIFLGNFLNPKSFVNGVGNDPNVDRNGPTTSGSKAYTHKRDNISDRAGATAAYAASAAEHAGGIRPDGFYEEECYEYDDEYDDGYDEYYDDYSDEYYEDYYDECEDDPRGGRADGHAEEGRKADREGGDEETPKSNKPSQMGAEDGRASQEGQGKNGKGATNGEKKKNDEQSESVNFGSKIKEGNKKIRNFFKDNFLKNNKKKASGERRGEREVRKRRRVKRRWRPHRCSRKGSYIIREAMCVVKLHDEVVDVRSLDDSTFYLVSIGKGVSPNSVSNHTVFIDADFARVDEHLRRTQEVSKSQEKSRTEQLLAEEENAHGCPELSSSTQERPTEAHKSLSISNLAPSECCPSDVPRPDKKDHFSPQPREQKNKNKNKNNREAQTNMVEKSKMNHIDAFFNLHVFKKKKTYFKSSFFHVDAHNGMFFKSNKKLRSVEDLADTVCLCVWDLCSILTNEEKQFLKGKIIPPAGSSDVGPNSLSQNGTTTISSSNNNNSNSNSHSYGRNEMTNRAGAKKLEKNQSVLHPTLVCIIGNLPDNKVQSSKRKNNESANSITTFCTWLSSRNHLYNVVQDPLDRAVAAGELTSRTNNKRTEQPSKGNNHLTDVIETPKKKKGIFWHLFHHKVYSNNFSQDAYVFYGDQLGYIHVVHLQMYKKVHFFRAFDVPILKVFVCKNIVTKLLVLADARLRIYLVESALAITLIKEVQIKHDVPPNKCICEEKINELKEKRKKEENENDGVSIFNLSYFLSSNYPKKQSNTRGDDKLSNVNGVNSVNTGPVDISATGGSLRNGSSANGPENLAPGGSITGVPNTSISFSGKKNQHQQERSQGNYSNYSNDSPQNPALSDAKSTSLIPLASEEKGKEKPSSSVKENNSTPPKVKKSSTSSNSVNLFKTVSDTEDEADANSDKDAYQSVIIGGINFGYLGFNFSKFMNNKKKTTIVDAYLLSNSHLVTVSSNGTLTLIKV